MLIPITRFYNYELLLCALPYLREARAKCFLPPLSTHATKTTNISSNNALTLTFGLSRATEPIYTKGNFYLMVSFTDLKWFGTLSIFEWALAY